MGCHFSTLQLWEVLMNLKQGIKLPVITLERMAV